MENNEFDASICPAIVFPLLASSTPLMRGARANSYVNNCFNARTLLDSGSSTSWIAPEILSKVKHQIIGTAILNVKTFNNQGRERYKLVEVYTNNKIIPSFRCFVMKSPSEAQIIPNLKEYLYKYFLENPNNKENFQNWNDPYDSNNIDHDSTTYGLIVSSSVINKIKRNDNYVVHDKKLGLEVLMENTCFGHTVSGQVPNKFGNQISHNSYKTQIDMPVIDTPDKQEYLFSEDHKLKNDLSIIWDKETMGIYDHELHMHDEATIKSFKDTVRLDPETGQYEVGLPFNNRKHLLKDNFRQAFARSRREQNNMISDEEYRNLFSEALETLKTHSYIEQVDMNQPVAGPIVYLPYRGIIRKDHSSTKCRIVMDASAKPSINDFSLNQALYTGPNKIADLAQCLLRFMLGKYACIADIKQVFLRIWIRCIDRDAQRFLVPEDMLDPNSKMLCFRYTYVMFGSVASPYLLAAVLEKHILDTCKNDLVKNALLTNTYVDNVSFAADLEHVIDSFFTESINDMDQGSFELRQWASNSKKLMACANALKIADNDINVNVLGMVWNVSNDEVSIKAKIKWNGKFTKRSVLAATNSIFDPLCYLGPIEIQNRLFLQKLWDMDMDWDDSFEHIDHLKTRWLELLASSQKAVEVFKIPREIVFMDHSEIHVFCDASNTSYGAALYILTPACKEYPNGYCKLVLSKGKVKPLKGSPKGNTIPKLELTAMLLGAGLVKFVKNTFNISTKTKTYLWSDARVVLDWLSSVDLDSTYVHRRVVDIRALCPDAVIRHVPSIDNPPDITQTYLWSDARVVLD